MGLWELDMLGNTVEIIEEDLFVELEPITTLKVCEIWMKWTTTTNDDIVDVDENPMEKEVRAVGIIMLDL